MPRRGENIRKRNDGRWEARYIIGKDENGKSLYASVYASKYNLVKQKRDEAIKNMGLEDSDPSYNYSFEYLCELWLKTMKHSVKESTFAVYSNTVSKHIIPYFKEKQSYEITLEDIQNFIAGISDSSLAASTQKTIFILLKKIIRYGYSMSYCKIQEIAISPVRSKAKESEIMPPQERQVFEAYLNQLDSPFAVGIKLCMYTGLRIGEISGLRWEDIDFEKELMHISRTVLRIEDTSPEGEKKTKLVIASPKTKTSDRQIPIPHFMIRELKKWRMREGTYVLNGKPAPMEPRLIQYHFHKYLEKCSLKQYNFHSIRHGFATMCIEKGFDMKSLSEILGHSTVSTTMNIYVHSSLEQKKIQMNKLGV